MKKVLLMAAICLSAMVLSSSARAAYTLYFESYDQLDINGFYYNGDALVYCPQLPGWSTTLRIEGEGVMSLETQMYTFEDSSSFVDGQVYTFYYDIVDGDYKYTSEPGGFVYYDGSTSDTVNFGSQGGAGQDSWTEVSAAPEPTSGLLILLGMGALALRRRRA